MRAVDEGVDSGEGGASRGSRRGPIDGTAVPDEITVGATSQTVADELERIRAGASILMTEQRRPTTPTPRLVMASP